MKDFLRLKFLVFSIFTNLPVISAATTLINDPPNENYCKRQQRFLFANLKPYFGIFDSLQQQRLTTGLFNLNWDVKIFAFPLKNNVELHKNTGTVLSITSQNANEPCQALSENIGVQLSFRNYDTQKRSQTTNNHKQF